MTCHTSTMAGVLTGNPRAHVSDALNTHGSVLFYMAIRYEGGAGWPNLELNNTVNGSTPWHGKLSVLLQWNAEDPPNAFEQRRNDVIHATYQHNRNPFIDHPEWAPAIFG